MQKILTTMTLALALPAGAAWAGDDCRVPAADWQPREAVEALAKENGWTLTRIKTDDGCYEIKGQDGKGRKLKARLDPAALALIEVKLGDADCSVPMAEWQPRAAVEAMAAEKGWSVSRIKIDDGCYEIKGRDSEGRMIEAELDPATLAVLEIEFEFDTAGAPRTLPPLDTIFATGATPASD